jgi:hypothetical protein
MANYYVDSNAAGAGTGADWANAYTTLDAAFAARSAGDVFFVAHNHAQTQASALTLTSPGTAASPCFVYCVTSAGSVPPVSADLRTTATITTTGANAITFGNQWCYFYGITFNAATGANTSGISLTTAGNSNQLNFQACALRKLSTSGTVTGIVAGATQGTVILDNTTLQFGATSDAIRPAGRFEWRNTASAVTGATIPTGLIETASPGYTLIEGVDLSALGSGTGIFRAGIGGQIAVLKDCKLGSSVTVASTPTSMALTVSLIRCDSGDTNYRTERYTYTGTLTTETTIVRTGGASDGTTPIAWKVVTTANSERIYPFECLPIFAWNDSVGSSLTVTVECRSASIPNLDEMWMEVEYLGTSGFPLGNFATSGHADLLATGTANTSSSETWGGSTSSFKLSKTITPQEKGPITVYVKIAKASYTVYVDPKITLS